MSASSKSQNPKAFRSLIASTEHLLPNCKGATLAIVASDSTVVYYKCATGLRKDPLYIEYIDSFVCFSYVFVFFTVLSLRRQQQQQIMILTMMLTKHKSITKWYKTGYLVLLLLCFNNRRCSSKRCAADSIRARRAECRTAVAVVRCESCASQGVVETYKRSPWTQQRNFEYDKTKS